LKDALADLQEKIRGGDVAAAGQLYRGVLQCSRAQPTLWKNMNMQDRFSKPSSAIANDPAALDTRARAAIALGKANEEWSRFCDGIGDDVLNTLPEVTLQAARMGDSGARACYILRGPLASPQSGVNNPALFADYASDAKSLINAGMAAGDWRVVAILQSAYAGAANYLPSGVTGFDPIMAYRYRRLYRLGVYDEEMAKSLDEEPVSGREGLTDEEIALSDQWALATFNANFKFSGDAMKVAPLGLDTCSIAEPHQSDASQ
jgi:hypothetical protein